MTEQICAALWRVGNDIGTDFEIELRDYITSLENDKVMYRHTIAELESPKTCETCQHRSDYAGEFTCKHLDSIINTSPQEPYGIYIQDADTLSCINYEQKDTE